jgi:hypothetical protein
MGGKPRRSAPAAPRDDVVLMARPLGVGPAAWPTSAGVRFEVTADKPVGVRTRCYGWATIHPDGSGGWTADYDASSAFPSHRLEELVDAWYEAEGTWPWEFQVVEV